MDERVKVRIRENFYSLISTTSCTLDFLLKFRQAGIMTLEDIEAIKGSNGKSPRMDEAYRFYQQVLHSQTDSYRILIKALQETKQTAPITLITDVSRTNLNLEFKLQSRADQSNVDAFKRTRGRHCDLPTHFLKESASGWTCRDLSCAYLNFTWMPECVRCGESRKLV